MLRGSEGCMLWNGEPAGGREAYGAETILYGDGKHGLVVCEKERPEVGAAGGENNLVLNADAHHPHVVLDPRAGMHDADDVGDGGLCLDLAGGNFVFPDGLHSIPSLGLAYAAVHGEPEVGWQAAEV